MRRRDAGIPAFPRRLLLAGWTLACVVMVARAVQLQVVEAETWRGLADAQHRTSTEVAAPRGTITDRDGVPLAVSREIYRVAVAPREMDSRDEVASALERTLGISRGTARRVTDPDGLWHVVPGRYGPEIRAPLARVSGVHLERRLERFYPHGDLARGVLGTVLDGEGRGGVEQAFDALLRGIPGRQVLARDNEGRPIPGEAFVTAAPRAGGEVRLTLDLDLQEIAQAALAEAVDDTGARGGDLLVADPRTGELLALASFRDGSAAALSAINAPYEPGSTLKPFTVAALLEHGLASLADTVDAEQGYWVAPGGKPLRDVHALGRVTLADALRESSNVGVAKAALPLTPAQQYENLRDFGFGVPTGIVLPGEVGGTLRRPERWTARSPVSLAIGYEVSVTPVQMTMAYGALANGGHLMEPRLVRETRDRAGRTLERPGPRRVRSVLSPRTARAIGSVLVDVVEDGTGTRARMSTFRVAGKSGTSRMYVAGSGYEAGRYYASFAGFFPADDPQLVVFVKLNEPEGSYYGGATAAPVTRTTLEAVLAARQAPIDRGALLKSVRATRPPAAEPSLRFANAAGRGGDDRGSPAPDALAYAARPAGPGSSDPAAGGHGSSVGGPVPVPDVAGLPARVAVRRLHALGFRVRWDGAGPAGATFPAAGARLMPGDTVLIRGGPLPSAGRLAGGAPPGRRGEGLP